MGIPGDNLLEDAFQCIDTTEFTYYAFDANATRPDGVKQPGYIDGVPYQGSIQAVDRSQYKEMGLSFSKSYIEIFAIIDIKGIERDRASDQLEWSADGRRYAVSKEVAWQKIDGWDNFVAVDIGPAL